MVHTPGKEIMAQLGLDYVARKHSLALVALNLSSLTQYPALYGPSISLSQGRPLIELSLLGVHAS